jgi:hypothetical protein
LCGLFFVIKSQIESLVNINKAGLREAARRQMGRDRRASRKGPHLARSQRFKII